jgi:hypothetical protein
MCNICYAQKNGISMIDSNVATLCDNHYQEWADEKSIGENWYE